MDDQAGHDLYEAISEQSADWWQKLALLIDKSPTMAANMISIANEEYWEAAAAEARREKA